MSLESTVKVKSDISELQRKAKWWLSRWRRYPLAFIIECCHADKLGYPVPWQIEMMNNLRDYGKVTIRSGHGVGKSRALAWLIWWFMICWKKDGRALKIPCTGPSSSNLSDVLWGEVRLVHKSLHPFFRDKFEMLTDECYCVEEREAWFVRLRTARREDPDALQGFHGDPCLFAIDEASAVADEVFEVARGALSGAGSFAVMTGNPTRNSGYFKESFYSGIWYPMHVNDEDQLSTRTFRYPYVLPTGETKMIEVNGRVSPDYVQEMRDEFGAGSSVYKARVLGEFPISDSNTLIRRDWIDKAIAREQNEDKNDTKLRVMGVDIAFQGDNDSAYIIRKGRCIEDGEVWHGNDPTQSADKIAGRFEEAKKAGKPIDKIAIDSLGVGAGVFSVLRKRGYPVVPVWSGNAAPEDGGTRCRYMKDWLYWKCRTYFRDSQPKIMFSGSVMERLIRELSAIEYKDSNGKIKIEDKGKTKTNKAFISGSPDVADALSNTFIVDNKINLKKKKSKFISKHDKRRKYKKIRPWRIV